MSIEVFSSALRLYLSQFIQILDLDLDSICISYNLPYTKIAIEHLEIPETGKELRNITGIIIVHQHFLQLVDNSKGKGDQANASQVQDYIPDKLAHLDRETAEEASHEPFEHPRRFLEHHYCVVEVRVEFLALPTQHGAEDRCVDVDEREAVLVQAQQHVTPIDCHVDEQPECVPLRVSDYEQITDDEVYALRVAHRWEMIADAFQDCCERFFLELYPREGTFDVLFYLGEGLVLEKIRFLYFLLTRGFFTVAGFLVRLFLARRPSLGRGIGISQTVNIGRSIAIEAEEDNLPFFHDADGHHGLGLQFLGEHQLQTMRIQLHFLGKFRDRLHWVEELIGRDLPE